MPSVPRPASRLPVVCSPTLQVACGPKCRFYIHREPVTEAADQIQNRSRELTAGQVTEAHCRKLRADHTHTLLAYTYCYVHLV